MKRIRTSVSGIVVALLMLSQLPISSLNAWSLLDVGTSFAQASQVSVTKSAPTEAHPGETLLYSIVVRNNGGTAVTGELNDPVTNFTAHLTLIPGESGSQTHPGTQCVTDPGGEVSCSPITISAGGVATYYLKFNVGLSAPCSGTFNNVASFTYDPGNITATSNTSATTYSCPPKVDLRVEKTGPSTIPQGGTIVYTVSAVHVSGPTATNVLVQDPAPNGVSFNPAQSDPSCQQQADIIICSTPSLAPGGRKDFAIAFNVPQQATCGSVITNTAALCTADQEDPVPGNDVFNGSINTTVTCAPQGADLSVTKSGPQSAQQGNLVSYSVTAHNAGPGSATNVVVSDVIPAGFTFNAAQSSNSCVLNGNGTAVLCNNFNLLSGENRSFTIAFNTPAAGQNCTQQTAQNQATVSSSSTDPNSGNNQSSVITTTLTCPSVTQPNVTITKSASTQARPGQTVQYSIIVRNNGSQPVTGELFDPVANFTAHLTLVPGQSTSSTHPGVQCVTDPGGEVSCSPVTINPGDLAAFLLTFNVSQAAPCSGTFNNVAQFIIDPGNIAISSNTSSTTFSCPPQVDLRIEKTGPSTVVQGGVIVYTVSAVHVSGPTATNVLVQDPAPNGVIFNAALSDPSCQQQADLIICSTPTLAPGARKDFALAFTVPQQTACGTVVTNTAAICKADQQDPVPGNDVFNANVNTTVICPQPQTADVSVQKSGPSSALAGGTVSYTVTATNAGPATATNVIVSDVVPAGLSFNAAQSSNSCTLNGNGTTVLCNNFNLNQGESRTFTLVFNLPQPGNSCQQSTVQNQATVSSSITDSNSSNNQSATIFTQIVCPQPQGADLLVFKNGPATALRGSTVGYSVSVVNAGPAASQNVIVTDIIPAGLTFNASLSSQSCGLNQSQTVVQCTIASLAANQSQAFAIVFDAPLIQNCTQQNIQNQATVTSSTADPASSNNASSIIVTRLDCPTPSSATLTIQKSGPSSVVRGSTFSYSLIVSNTSQTTAQNVQVLDPVPFGLTYQLLGSDPSCSVQANDVVCTIGTLTAGQTRTFTLNFQAPASDPCASAVVQNRAFVTSTQSNLAQSQIVSTTVTCAQVSQPDLTMEKTGPSTVTRGGTLTYVLTVRNTGGQVANNVFVTDPVPSGLTYQPSGSTSTCSLQSGSVSCNVGTLAAGEARVLTLNFLVPDSGSCSQMTIQNVAAATTTSAETTTANNQSTTVTTSILCPNVQFAIQKTDNRSTVQPGENVTYTITVQNLSSTNASNVMVTDPMPSLFAFTSASDGGFLNGQTVTWNNLFIGANSSRTLTIQGQISPGASNGNVITNTATVNGVTASDTTLVRDDDTNDRVRIDVTASPDDVCVDETISYTIAVRNDGSASATVDLRAFLDTRTVFESANDGGRNMGAGEVRWDNIRVSRNSTEFVTLRVRVRTGSYSDSIRLRVDGGDNQEDIETTRVRTNCGTVPPPSQNVSLFVSKQADRSEAQPGDTVHYSVTVRNTSNVPAYNVSVEDTFPAHQLTIGDAGGGTVGGDRIRWTVGTLSANETRTFTYNGTLRSSLRQGDVVQNNVRVTADNIGAVPNAVASVRIIQILPATGAGFTGPLSTVGAMLRPFGVTSSSSSIPSILWLSIALMGLAAGGGLGKRYFFSL